ncbi:MAG: hypothetical protein C4K49_11095 [Candidatus Thorarchaeota archaeon]|nr:MAG: hypothetical protein C4K49_11095 [Candidatus Thorarchaeota archaeon]
MLLEKLMRGDSFLDVGIAHLKNSKRLGKTALVSLASQTRPHTLAVQFLSPTLIACGLHVLSAAQNAVNAWFGGYAVSRGLDIEIAIYASGQRQIGPALDAMGVRDGMSSLALVVIGEGPEIVQEVVTSIIRETGIEVDPPFVLDEARFRRIMEHFNIGEVELRSVSESDDPEAMFIALCRCIASRVSMVAIDT